MPHCLHNGYRDYDAFTEITSSLKQGKHDALVVFIQHEQLGSGEYLVNLIHKIARYVTRLVCYLLSRDTFNQIS